MKICFGIIGLPRCIDLIIYNLEKLFDNFDICLCLSKNPEKYEIEYSNNQQFDDKNSKIKKILFIEDQYDNKFRNCLNYSYKLKNLIQNLEDNYDLYIIIRSDFIFEDKKFLENSFEEDYLYFSNKSNNEFTTNVKNKINDQIIISKSLKSLNFLKDIFSENLNDYFEIILYNFFLGKNYKLININYKLILSQCNLIAISGDSASGKTTMSELLSLIFKNNLKLETDRYHKWERGNENYNTYTHLNPNANYLEKMSNDIYTLKIGNEIFSVDYNHTTGKFTPEEKIVPSDQIILCGLHTLFDTKLNNFINLKIFMDTDRELIIKWKIKRDVIERGYSKEKVLNQINKREQDYKNFIEIQKHNANIIINYYEIEEKLMCRMIIKINKDKVLTFLIENNYTFQNDKDLIIHLKNDIDKNLFSKYNIDLKNFDNYYLEILYIILLII